MGDPALVQAETVVPGDPPRFIPIGIDRRHSLVRQFILTADDIDRALVTTDLGALSALIMSKRTR
jgi:hypothetical protein